MLTKQDFIKLRTMFGELLEENNRVLKREMREEMQAHNRQLRREIVSDIGAIIDEGILPQIAELQVHVGLRPKRAG